MTHDASRRDFLKLTGRAALLTAVAAPAASLLTAGPAAAETGAMWWPVTGKVNDLIGSRPGGKHDGIDIEAASGTAVYAAYDGVARRKEERDKNRNLVGYGQYIDVEHAGGWTTRYAHLSAYVIANGATVTRGTLIGKVGSTGRSTGPHLHFEARRNGTRYDNMNTATKTGAQVKEKTPITVDFAGLGAAPAGNTPANPYFRGVVGAPKTSGYWLFARDGGVFSYEATFYGSMGGQQLNAPVVGMAAHPAGTGYWLTAADGGIFAFGASQFHGSMGGQRLNSPVVGMAAHPSGNGYWLTAADGGIFAFGASQFQGSTGSIRLNSPVVGMSASTSGNGYWLAAGDGGLFAFGDARFIESGVGIEKQ